MNTIKCNINVNSFSDAIDILNAIERAQSEDLIEAIDITNESATIVGTNLSSVMFQMSSMGYVATHGPKQTHLFINLKKGEGK